MIVESADLEGSFGVCAVELKLSLHHGPAHLTWSAASPKFGPEHLYSHGRTCAIHVMRLASMDKNHKISLQSFLFTSVIYLYSYAFVGFI